MSLLLSHPTGNHNVRQALQAFLETGQLGEFCTTVSWNDRGALAKVLPATAQAQLSRRSYDDSLRSITRTHSAREVARLICGAANMGWPTRRETGPFSIDAVCRSLDRWVAKRISTAKRRPTTVYCYEDCAENTFAAAKTLDIRRVYEHPVGYWREVQRVFEEERERQPEFTPIIAGIDDSLAKRERKDQEIAKADLIIAPSRYSAASLRQCPNLNAPIEIVNYGSPGMVATGISESESPKLKVLFVGSLQQRKGVSYLIKACQEMASAIEVTVIGSRVAPCAPVDQWLESTQWTPSAPHARVLDVMRQCDVLALPSLSEGFGLVVLEAMSQGLTVIVSDNTGAADAVEDGVNGFIVPIRSSSAIAEKIETLYQDRDRLMSMRNAALETARTRTWDKYRAELASVVCREVVA